MHDPLCDKLPLLPGGVREQHRFAPGCHMYVFEVRVIIFRFDDFAIENRIVPRCITYPIRTHAQDTLPLRKLLCCGLAYPNSSPTRLRWARIAASVGRNS